MSIKEKVEHIDYTFAKARFSYSVYKSLWNDEVDICDKSGHYANSTECMSIAILCYERSVSLLANLWFNKKGISFLKLGFLEDEIENVKKLHNKCIQNLRTVRDKIVDHLDFDYNIQLENIRSRSKVFKLTEVFVATEKVLFLLEDLSEKKNLGICFTYKLNNFKF